MNEELKRQFDIPIRWMMGDLFVNNSVKNGRLKTNKFNIENFGGFDVMEVNMSSIALSCVAIELFGRIILGYGDDKRRVVPEQAFRTFSHYYLGRINNRYKIRNTTLLNNYRNNFLHSYILGYGGKRGFFPTRDGRQESHRHLLFLKGSKRLIINIDEFVRDIKKALEYYLKDVNLDRKIYPKLGILVNPRKYRQNTPTSVRPIVSINLRKNAKKALKKFRFVV